MKKIFCTGSVIIVRFFVYFTHECISKEVPSKALKFEKLRIGYFSTIEEIFFTALVAQTAQKAKSRRDQKTLNAGPGI